MRDGYGRHTPNLTGNYVTRAIRVDVALASHVGDAITGLTDAVQWLEVGDTIEDIQAAAFVAVDSYYGGFMIGAIFPFLGEPPVFYLLCDGSTYLESDFPELFAALDSQFKDVPNGTFTLPDLSGVFLSGSGGGAVLGDSGGKSVHQLTIDELPAHSHDYQSTIIDIDVKTLGAPDPAGARTGPILPTTLTGGNAAHENRPPFLTVNYAVFAGREIP